MERESGSATLIFATLVQEVPPTTLSFYCFRAFPAIRPSEKSSFGFQMSELLGVRPLREVISRGSKRQKPTLFFMGSQHRIEVPQEHRKDQDIYI